MIIPFQTYHILHHPSPKSSAPMASLNPFTIFLLSFLTITHHTLSTSLYLSPKTLFPNYNNMLHSFKIFIYPPPPPSTLFSTPQESQFYTSLLNSPFLTQDPNHAHLFFLPFPSSTSTRNLARVIKTIRTNFPFWNRTLGADHFYLSAAGVDFSSDRNVVELKKNAIQISCFPVSSGLFIPHKDVTLPPMHTFHVNIPSNIIDEDIEKTYLGYMKITEKMIPIPYNIVEEVGRDDDFKVEIESEGEDANRKKEKYSSRFCLFVYGSDMTWMVEAMGAGCVPVVITDRPIQDLPLIDVIDWSEIAVFVGASGGVKGLKRVLDGIEKSSGRYGRMVESGVAAVQHLVWNAEPKAHDAFHMVVYQLWLRRHTIRYARWVEQ